MTPEEQLTAMVALLAWGEVWMLDGDLCRCRKCKRGINVERMNEAFVHRHGCPNAHLIAPWQDLRSRIPGNKGTLETIESEFKSLRKIHDNWYSFYESVIYIPCGEVPQVKGSWKDSDQTQEMVRALQDQYPDALIYVASSRCGDIDLQSAEEWLEMRKIGMECAEEEAAYVGAGICADCGACSLKDAEGKCKPRSLADTGDYICAGERLWEGQKT